VSISPEPASTVEVHTQSLDRSKRSTTCQHNSRVTGQRSTWASAPAEGAQSPLHTSAAHGMAVQPDVFSRVAPRLGPKKERHDAD
jgi:hypothetical protein